MVRQGLGHCEHCGLKVVGEQRMERGGRLPESGRPYVWYGLNMPLDEQATRQITATCPSILVIGLSVHNSPQVESAMKEAGAAAYLTKDAAPEQLNQAISSAILQKRTTS